MTYQKLVGLMASLLTVSVVLKQPVRFLIEANNPNFLKRRRS